MRIMLFICLLASQVIGAEWYTIRTNEYGVVTGCGYTDSPKEHILEANEVAAPYTFPTNEFKYWKKENSDWVAMTPEEQIAADIAEEARFQSQKSDETKYCENKFILLCEQLTGVKEKCGFGELTLLMDEIKQTNSIVAFDLSLQLIALDAQLKRASGMMWWDTASYHPEITPMMLKRRDELKLRILKKSIRLKINNK